MNIIVCLFQGWQHLREEEFSWAKSSPCGNSTRGFYQEAFVLSGQSNISLLMNFTNEKNKLMFYAQGFGACSMYNSPHPSSSPEGRGHHSTRGNLGVTSSSHTPGAVAHLPVSPHAQFPQSVEGQLIFSTRK